MRLLIAEDEKNLNKIMTRQLEDSQYQVDSCFDGEEALAHLAMEEYDAVILDIMMPQKDGLQVLTELRRRGDDTPVLMLTALDRIEDRVNGLDRGADDYLTKPFAFEELLARIRVLTRKKAGNSTNVFTLADLTLDTQTRRVTRGGTEISLSSKEFSILQYMILNKNIVLSRDKLERHIWSYDYEGSSNMIDVYIRYLRKKIDEPFEQKLIHTVRGAGYVLREQKMKTKRWSIKARVTFWYVFFLIFLTVLLLAALLYNSDHLTRKNIKGDLVTQVENSTRDVKIRDNTLRIDDDMISYRDGVSVLVYGENNFIITGNLPENVPAEIPFVPGKVRKIKADKHSFYVYDYLMDGLKGTDIWVRGIVNADPAETFPATFSAIKLFIILLPALIALASIGGYFLTRRALRPVARITETVNQIQAGGDLSRRVGIQEAGGSRDEIYSLSATFDRMLDRLETSFLSEKQFSDDASHELRTPISVILSQCEYALKDTASPAEVKSALEISLQQAQKMSGLVSQLLTLARADRGANKLVPEKIDLSELLDIVCMEQEDSAAERQITLCRDIQPEIVSAVDQTLMMRLMINLISNSIRYGREGGTTRITLKQTEDSAVLRIADDGIGISEENLSKIWDRFFQANPSRSTDSLGLGLSMVKWIAEAHGGTITAESRLDEGTAFTLTLPLREEESK